uniref:Uncharacterized protein n=1 Tax=Zea mays TaxID=4577 RepID=A0A804PPP8_MAIZE
MNSENRDDRSVAYLIILLGGTTFHGFGRNFSWISLLEEALIPPLTLRRKPASTTLSLPTEGLPGSTGALRVETSFEDSTELWILLARGSDDVDHRTAEVGLDGLDAVFSFPAAATAVVRRADDETEKGFGVSGRVAAAVALPPPPPVSLRREDIAGVDAELGFGDPVEMVQEERTL